MTDEMAKELVRAIDRNTEEVRNIAISLRGISTELRIPGQGWYAGQALAGLLADPRVTDTVSAVKTAWKVSDEMMKESGDEWDDEGGEE